MTAERIKQLRKEREWSAQKLGEEMARVGIPWNRSIVVNIEQGRRSYITVEELVALGRVLGVPPMLLALPFDQLRQIAVLPNASVPTWAAAQWFAGHAPFPTTSDQRDEWEANQDAFDRGAVPVELWDQHQGNVKAWQQATWDQEMARRQAGNAHDEESRDALLRKARAAELEADRIANVLWEVRRRMRQHGILAPELPEALRHVDTERSPLERAIVRAYEGQEGGSGGGPDQAS